MKRSLDILISALLLLVLAVPLLIFAVAVRVRLGSPVLFKQVRTGLNGEPFRMVKFRTMTDCRDADGALLPDSMRLTKFGRFMRSTSIDELPELWNVLKGEMSLVGPRPLLIEYVPLYSKEEARRHAVRPGITGWAQINGRNTLDWREKFKFDVWYVDHNNFMLDLKILCVTAKKVILRDGINSLEDATVPAFTGNHSDETQK